MQEAILESAELSLKDFSYFRDLIYELAGISLSEAKLTLIQSRLRSRMQCYGMLDFSEYRQLLQSLSRGDEELQAFINALTTNKTDWFREDEHFHYVVNEFLPKWKTLGKKHLQVWCAASSTGEESYTLSLVLHHALKGSGITYEIKSSDIDTKVINHAQNGVYAKDRLYQVPEKYHSGFMFGKNGIESWMKIRKEIKDPVSFFQLNLTHTPYKLGSTFDLILCRNVLIYFNSKTIEKVVEGLFESTAKDSVLIIAHSESLQNIKTSWKYLRPSIFTKGKSF
jgi:chemotaxis protein methyltransferase CheR